MTEKTSRYTNPIILLFIATLLLVGCQTAYYSALEQFGIHKRDLLVKRVENARDAQEEAKEQFKSALEQFSSVIHIEDGELKQKYEKLNAELEQSESKANAVKNRIESVENVSQALFQEWQAELEKYSNDNLRQISQQKLTATQQQYEQLISAMKRAEQKIGPVLTTFRDQVLSLKHSLNAQAIASIQDELVAVETDIASLIKEMETSINEANTFINAMSKE